MKKTYIEELTKLYTEIHKNPELSGNEFNTLCRIERFCKKWELDFFSIEGCYYVKRKEAITKPLFLLRAELDALPMKEKTSLEYRSINSNMHSCGHDANLFLCLSLLEHSYEHFSFILFLESKEETIGSLLLGLQKIKNYPILSAFTFHAYPSKENLFYGKEDIILSESVSFQISVKAQKGHIALEKEERIHFQFLEELFKITSSYRKDSILLEIPFLRSGVSTNIFPEKLILKGSMRSLNPKIEVKNFYEKWIQEIQNLCEKYHVKGNYKLLSYYPPVINDSQYHRLFMECYQNQMKKVNPMYLTDDFGYTHFFYPSYYLFYGVDTFPLHHPSFCIPISRIYEVKEELLKFFSFLDTNH